MLVLQQLANVNGGPKGEGIGMAVLIGLPGGGEEASDIYVMYRW